MRLSKPTLATNHSIVLRSGCHDNWFLRPAAAVGEEMGARRGRTDTVLDRESPVPLYYQLAQNMETAIRSGRLSSGSHLENEIELARQLRVSRPTVRRAIALLANRGLVIRRHGIGTLGCRCACAARCASAASTMTCKRPVRFRRPGYWLMKSCRPPRKSRAACNSPGERAYCTSNACGWPATSRSP